MKNTIATLIMGLGFAAAPMAAMPAPLIIGGSDSVRTVLETRKNQRVTVKLASGEELTGIVKLATEQVVHLAQLSGKEFYDAVVATKSIAALIIRTKD